MDNGARRQSLLVGPSARPLAHHQRRPVHRAARAAGESSNQFDCALAAMLGLLGEATASIWPLIVDGLRTTATVELWKTGRDRRAGGPWAAWLAFVFGLPVAVRQHRGGAGA